MVPESYGSCPKMERSRTRARRGSLSALRKLKAEEDRQVEKSSLTERYSHGVAAMLHVRETTESAARSCCLWVVYICWQMRYSISNGRVIGDGYAIMVAT